MQLMRALLHTTRPSASAQRSGIHTSTLLPSTAAVATAKAEKPYLKPLYLDAQATTPVDYRVLDAMLPYLTNQYGNPHSRTHAFGWESEKAVEVARQVSGRSRTIGIYIYSAKM